MAASLQAQSIKLHKCPCLLAFNFPLASVVEPWQIQLESERQAVILQVCCLLLKLRGLADLQTVTGFELFWLQVKQKIIGRANKNLQRGLFFWQWFAEAFGWLRQSSADPEYFSEGRSAVMPTRSMNMLFGTRRQNVSESAPIPRFMNLKYIHWWKHDGYRLGWERATAHWCNMCFPYRRL